MEFIRSTVRERSEIDDAGLAYVSDKLAIELGPALGFDLTFQIALDVEIGPWAKLLRDKILRPGAHAFLDVVAGDDEVLAVVGAAAQDDMNVGVVGVPMINADPASGPSVRGRVP
jgi:hypothetical protein